MTTKTAKTIVFSKAIKADIEPHVSAVRHALLRETKAVFGANEARLNLCLALGNIKRRIEDAVVQGELERGAWKVWCQRNYGIIKVAYTTANRYANVGLAEDPKAEFEAYKERDLAAQYKAQVKRDKEAKEKATREAEEALTSPSNSFVTEPVVGSAGNSNAGNEQRQTEEIPTPDGLAETIRNSVTSLAKFPAGNEKGEKKVLGMAREVVVESADALGMAIVPEGAFVVTANTEADVLANWLFDSWKKHKLVSLTKHLNTLSRMSKEEDDGMAELEACQLESAAKPSPSARKTRARKAAAAALDAARNDIVPPVEQDVTAIAAALQAARESVSA